MGGGILWDDGKIWGDKPEQWARLGAMLRKARAGIWEAADKKAVAEPKVILHHEAGGNLGAMKWFFDKLMSQGGFNDFDVIGVNFYSFWNGQLSLLQENLKQLASRYGKELAVMETAYPWTLAGNNEVSQKSQLHPGYDASKDGQKNFIRDIRKAVANVSGGLGIFYFAPEWIQTASFGSSWENNALFEESGKMNPGLEALGDH